MNINLMMSYMNPATRDTTISYVALPSTFRLDGTPTYCNYTNVVSDEVFESLMSDINNIDNFSLHLENELLLANWAAVKLTFKKNEVIEFFQAATHYNTLYFCTGKEGMNSNAVFFIVPESSLHDYKTLGNYVPINIDDVNK